MLSGARVGSAIVVALTVSGCDLERGPVTPPLDSAPGNAAEAERERPSVAYLRFVRAVALAESLEGLGPFLTDQVRAHVLHLSPRKQGDRLASAKRDMPARVTVTHEATEGDLATLGLAGLRAGKMVRGKAMLVREESRWRVQDEAWEP